MARRRVLAYLVPSLLLGIFVLHVSAEKSKDLAPAARTGADYEKEIRKPESDSSKSKFWQPEDGQENIMKDFDKEPLTEEDKKETAIKDQKYEGNKFANTVLESAPFPGVSRTPDAVNMDRFGKPSERGALAQKKEEQNNSKDHNIDDTEAEGKVSERSLPQIPPTPQVKQDESSSKTAQMAVPDARNEEKPGIKDKLAETAVTNTKNKDKHTMGNKSSKGLLDEKEEKQNHKAKRKDHNDDDTDGEGKVSEHSFPHTALTPQVKQGESSSKTSETSVPNARNEEKPATEDNHAETAIKNTENKDKHAMEDKPSKGLLDEKEEKQNHKAKRKDHNVDDTDGEGKVSEHSFPHTALTPQVKQGESSSKTAETSVPNARNEEKTATEDNHAETAIKNTENKDKHAMEDKPSKGLLDEKEEKQNHKAKRKDHNDDDTDGEGKVSKHSFPHTALTPQVKQGESSSKTSETSVPNARNEEKPATEDNHAETAIKNTENKDKHAMEDKPSKGLLDEKEEKQNHKAKRKDHNDDDTDGEGKVSKHSFPHTALTPQVKQGESSSKTSETSVPNARNEEKPATEDNHAETAIKNTENKDKHAMEDKPSKGLLDEKEEKQNHKAKRKDHNVDDTDGEGKVSKHSFPHSALTPQVKQVGSSCKTAEKSVPNARNEEKPATEDNLAETAIKNTENKDKHKMEDNPSKVAFVEVEEESRSPLLENSDDVKSIETMRKEMQSFMEQLEIELLEKLDYYQIKLDEQDHYGITPGATNEEDTVDDLLSPSLHEVYGYRPPPLAPLAYVNEDEHERGHMKSRYLLTR